MSTSARTVSASAILPGSTGISARRSSTSTRCNATKRVSPRMGPLSPTRARIPDAAPRTSSWCATRTPKPRVWWDNNNAMTVEHFDALLADFIAHAKGKTLFAQDLYGGADPQLRIRARVFTEYAWHSLFIRNLLIRPPVEDLATFVPELTIVDLPSFRADPKRHGARSETIIACDFTRKIVLIGGTSYAGEMKKSVFTVLNYLLPAKQVMPMHCSANTGAGRRFGDLLRPLRHRQDDALRRSAPHAHRRRRARVGPQRNLQFRGRLLRQGDQAVARGGAGDLCDDRTFRHRHGERDARSGVEDSRLRRRIEDREYAYRLSAQFHRQRVGDRARRSSQEHHHADLRRVRRVAADREARSGAGDVSFSVRLHRQGGRHGEGRHRAASDVFDLFRRAVPAAAPDGLWRTPARIGRASSCRLLARQHRVDRAASSALEGACRSG